MKDVCFATLLKPSGNVWEASDTSGLLLEASVPLDPTLLSLQRQRVHPSSFSLSSLSSQVEAISDDCFLKYQKAIFPLPRGCAEIAVKHYLSAQYARERSLPKSTCHGHSTYKQGFCKQAATCSPNNENKQMVEAELKSLMKISLTLVIKHFSSCDIAAKVFS